MANLSKMYYWPNKLIKLVRTSLALCLVPGTFTVRHIYLSLTGVNEIIMDLRHYNASTLCALAVCDHLV